MKTIPQMNCITCHEQLKQVATYNNHLIAYFNNRCNNIYFCLTRKGKKWFVYQFCQYFTIGKHKLILTFNLDENRTVIHFDSEIIIFPGYVSKERFCALKNYL